MMDHKHESTSSIRIENFLHNDKDIAFYTGFPSSNALQQWFRLLNHSGSIIYQNSTGKSKMIKEHKLTYLNHFFSYFGPLTLGAV